MSAEKFVMLILCSKATLDDVVHAREKFDATVVDFIHFDSSMDYFAYREGKFDGGATDIKLLFVFGYNDYVMVKNEEDIKKVGDRLKNGEC